MKRLWIVVFFLCLTTWSFPLSSIQDLVQQFYKRCFKLFIHSTHIYWILGSTLGMVLGTGDKEISKVSADHNGTFYLVWKRQSSSYITTYVIPNPDKCLLGNILRAVREVTGESESVWELRESPFEKVTFKQRLEGKVGVGQVIIGNKFFRQRE